jgi:hypothetical protein
VGSVSSQRTPKRPDGAAGQGAPLRGVIALLEKLEVETKQEGEAEAASYQKFTYWCKRSTKMLKRAMKKEKRLIEELDDKVDGLAADIGALAEDIATLEKQLGPGPAEGEGEGDAQKRE